ncbi:HD domain-containing protein [Deinococcus humi]|uniref:(P)ppGpp synthase/HD superfamily hydrolase n=1 Tax=Deinococcus humi TaxID=662880 RepID=A0A7W8JUX2_9DEIO|nr:HD domain-containing protein [Deinococcus humi]MBB5363400.1 (p)ppGpp synthase/HD superfamily hydrolase [Deinococcus humi]GGO26708.1 hypothetical protein GCM10008949_17710 [Deinococcus humi]
MSEHRQAIPLTNRFAEAMTVAHRWHAGHFRKGTPTPYISHLLGVASIALEYGANEDEAIAALLHDALEDGPENTGIDATELRKDIVRQFGANVARLVDGATDATPQAGEPKAPWAERKTAYLGKLLQEKNASSLLISASDKVHNAQTILNAIKPLSGAERVEFFKRFNQGLEGTLQYYRFLVDAYRRAPGAQGRVQLQALFDLLDGTVTAIEEACGTTAEDVRRHPMLRGVLPA